MGKNISDSDREKFSIAQELSEKGDSKGVFSIMKELVESNPEIGIFRAILANTYWDLGDIESAEKEFLNAVKLSPTSEKASLGLFHCLWEQDKKDEAFEEMKRFTSLVDSEEYKKIIRGN